MIADHLAAYYEAFGSNPTHRVIKSVVVNGHEIALVENQGAVIWDASGLGREGQPYLTTSLACECEFRRGIGWWQSGDDEPVRCYGDFDRTCEPRRAAQSQLEPFLRTYHASAPLGQPASIAADLVRS